MPDGYDLHDGRFLQERGATSAPNALLLETDVVPTGKIRTYLSISASPNVAETRTVQWQIVGRSGSQYGLVNPQQIALAAALFFPGVTEGMEIKLFPGEKFRFVRDVATAGSTISINVRFIETDLPPYDYIEPQERKRITALKHSITKAMGGGGVVGGGGGVVTPPGTRGGGRGGSEPY